MEGDLQLGIFLKTMKSSLLFPFYLSCCFHCMQVKDEDKPSPKNSSLIAVDRSHWSFDLSLEAIYFLKHGAHHILWPFIGSVSHLSQHDTDADVPQCFHKGSISQCFGVCWSLRGQSFCWHFYRYFDRMKTLKKTSST